MGSSALSRRCSMVAVRSGRQREPPPLSTSPVSRTTVTSTAEGSPGIGRADTAPRHAGSPAVPRIPLPSPCPAHEASSGRGRRTRSDGAGRCVRRPCTGVRFPGSSAPGLPRRSRRRVGITPVCQTPNEPRERVVSRPLAERDPAPDAPRFISVRLPSGHRGVASAEATWRGTPRVRLHRVRIHSDVRYASLSLGGFTRPEGFEPQRDAGAMGLLGGVVLDVAVVPVCELVAGLTGGWVHGSVGRIESA